MKGLAIYLTSGHPNALTSIPKPPPPQEGLSPGDSRAACARERTGLGRNTLPPLRRPICRPPKGSTPRLSHRLRSLLCQQLFASHCCIAYHGFRVRASIAAPYYRSRRLTHEDPWPLTALSRTTLPSILSFAFREGVHSFTQKTSSLTTSDYCQSGPSYQFQFNAKLEAYVARHHRPCAT